MSESETETIAPVIHDRRSRRDLLLGAAGALGVVAVGSMLEASPAAAADGDAVKAGQTTLAEHATVVSYDGASAFPSVVLLGNDSTYSTGTSTFPAAAGGWAGAGTTAGHGNVPNGVYGFTDNGAGSGVVGVNNAKTAGAAIGVQGISNSTTDNAVGVKGLISASSPGGFSAAVRGQNNGTGGLGIGVWASQNGSGWGVYATSASGIGVNASGGSGVGVEATGAVGVEASGSATGLIASGPTAINAQANSASGIGVLAANSAGGLALKATGNAQFLGVTKFARSGHVTIHANHRTATIHHVALSASSLILATVQTSAGVSVQSAVPHVSGKYFVLTLDSAVPAGKTVKVAWFIVN